MSEHSIQFARGADDRDPVGSTASCNGNWDSVDALLDALPPGIPILPPEDAGNFEKYTHGPPRSYAPGDGWRNCARALEKYDAELCKGYREEIDTLLVFAGLFSAVVTAFTIESYQWLQRDANDAIVVLLSHIAQSVSSNGTAAPLVSAPVGLPRSVSVRINTYWFLALALSLSAALVSILCKQWVREFERNPGLSAEEFLRIHQMKLEGFENWGVAGVISLLPLLLQSALAIFALGVLELLWQLHSTVAAVVCVPTILALFFYIATTLLPAVHNQYTRSHLSLSVWHKLSQCPYKSPQAMLALRAYNFSSWILRMLSWLFSYPMHLLALARHRLAVRLRLPSDEPLPYSPGVPRPQPVNVLPWHVMDPIIVHWLDLAYDSAGHPLSPYRCLRWIITNLNDGDIREWTWRCLWETADTRDRWFPYSDDLLERGLNYINSGLADVPRSGSRALALEQLSFTPAPRTFVLEAFLQNMGTLDCASAEYLTGVLAQRLYLVSDSQAAVTTLRVASAYVRAHVQEPVGTFLYNTTIIAGGCSDPHMRSVLRPCAYSLYVSWLRAQPVPLQAATVEATEKMTIYFWWMLLAEDDGYVSHPERLRRRPDVHDLAELVRAYAQFREQPLVSLSAALFMSAGDAETRIGPAFRELLEIAREGIGQDRAAAPSAESGVSRGKSSASLHDVARSLPSSAGPDADVQCPAPNEESRSAAPQNATLLADHPTPRPLVLLPQASRDRRQDAAARPAASLRPAT